MPTSLMPALGLLLTIVIGTSVMASDKSDEELLKAVWQSPEESASFFSEQFLRQILTERLATLLNDLIRRCGAV